VHMAPPHLLAPSARVGAGRDLGARVARAAVPGGCPMHTRVGQSLPGRQLCAGEKGGDAVGKTKVGQGSTVMVVPESQGLPIGLHVASAQPPRARWRTPPWPRSVSRSPAVVLGHARKSWWRTRRMTVKPAVTLCDGGV
jgi:hypothetical protein